MNPWEMAPEPMAANEGQAFYLEYTWVDRNGDPATPTEIRVASFDDRTGEELLAPMTIPGPYDTKSVIRIPPEATACPPGMKGQRMVAIELVVMFGDDPLTVKQLVHVRPLHMV